MNRSIESDSAASGDAMSEAAGSAQGADIAMPSAWSGSPFQSTAPDAFPPESEDDVESSELVESEPSAPLQADTSALFKQLVHDHRERLYRFVLKNIGNSTDAEEITQQAFMEAARSYATYRGESAVSTWIYGIAMNLTRNYLSRSPHRKYDFVDEQSLETLASNEVDPADALANRQAIEALQRELAELPDEIREVLLLVALDEVSYEDAAVMLSIPVGTVRSRVSRARAKLRQRLTSAGIELGF